MLTTNDDGDGETLRCRDCGTDFLYEPGERRLFESCGFDPPVRCRACRQAKAARRAGDGTGYGRSRG